MCARERNWLSTEANERSRVGAGYGAHEGDVRVDRVSHFLLAYLSFPLSRPFWRGEERNKTVIRIHEIDRMMKNTFHSPI